MVLGLRLPGAGERFEQMLEEHTRPIRPATSSCSTPTASPRPWTRRATCSATPRSRTSSPIITRSTPAGIRERVLREVRAFVGEAEPHDDMTMVVLKIGAGRARRVTRDR